ncbi:hypothetical protein HZ326_12018 [Fusarium oxysporum f. sp. albedinis]|nr:hypothetical protein HZ326_12018 [Fusarium oxysporum f. sp. albedinis]
MWDHARTLVPKSRNGASPGSKACGRVPGVALCTWYSDCAGEPGVSRHINLGRQREVLMRRERQTARSRRLRLKARTNVGARPPDSSGMYHPTPEVITLVAWIGISGKAARVGTFQQRPTA